MNLALIIYGSLSTPSGGYLYDRRLVEHFKRQGDQVEIISLPWRDYARHLGDNFSALLLRSLEGLRVDVLLQDELNHPSLVLLNQRLRRPGHAPIVSIVHHLRSSEKRPGWQNMFYRWLERCYLASVDGFIFNSYTTRGVVQGLLGCQTCPPWTVAYPAGDRLGALTEDEIEQRTQEPGPLHLVFVGNLIPRKNLHMLLEALRRIPREEWLLWVAGSQNMDPAYVTAVRRQSEQAGLGDRVHFMGYLGEEQLTALLRSSQLLILPSTYEGFGIAYLEGMGFGLPALASTTGAAGEIITHGENGFLVDPEDPDALAACLKLLMKDRYRLGRMSQAALYRFHQHPTWEQSASQVRFFLQSLISDR